VSRYAVCRTAPDLDIEGDLLAMAGAPAQGRPRWFEGFVFRTVQGQFVLAERGCSSLGGEVVHGRAMFVARGDDLPDACRLFFGERLGRALLAALHMEWPVTVVA
jgi:hypothetical protein